MVDTLTVVLPMVITDELTVIPPVAEPPPPPVVTNVVLTRPVTYKPDVFTDAVNELPIPPV